MFQILMNAISRDSVCTASAITLKAAFGALAIQASRCLLTEPTAPVRMCNSRMSTSRVNDPITVTDPVIGTFS